MGELSDHPPLVLPCLLDQLPRDGWTEDQRTKFLDAFVRVLDLCIPLRTNSKYVEPF